MIHETGLSNKLPQPFDAWKLIDDKGAQLIKIELKPREAIEPHSNPWSVIFYMIEGNGELYLDGKKNRLGSGMATHIMAGTVRGITNTGNSTLHLLVFKILADHEG